MSCPNIVDITANCRCHLQWWVCLVVSDGGVVPGAAARARVTVMYRGAAGSRHQPAHMVFSCSPALAGAGHHRDSVHSYDYYSRGGGGGVLCVFRLYR